MTDWEVAAKEWRDAAERWQSLAHANEALANLLTQKLEEANKRAAFWERMVETWAVSNP